MATLAPITLDTEQATEGYSDGVKKLAALTRSYFALDGEQIQFNVVSTETLRDAQKHPEKYQNLLVRVAGYSAYFVTIDPQIQEDIIARTEHNLG
jgi:trans-4-hydroxy-L-proline dehydratase